MKLLRIFMISIVTLILLGSSVFAITGKVTGSKVRIREEASSESKEISIATEGETVEIIGEEGDWYKVNFEKYTGYMSKDYVDANYSPENNETTTPPAESNTTVEPENNPPEEDTPIDEVQTPTDNELTTPEQNTPEENTNNELEYQVGGNITFLEETSLKYLPNFSSREISKAEKDSSYTITAVLNNWIKVSNDTNSGWVLSLKVSGNTTETTPNTTLDEQNSTTSEENNPPENTRKGTVNVESARLRKEPDGETLDSIKEGTEVTILGEEGDWYNISVDKYDDCYIAKRLITEK